MKSMDLKSTVLSGSKALMFEFSKLKPPTYRFNGEHKGLSIAPVLAQRRKSDSINLRQRITMGE